MRDDILQEKVLEIKADLSDQSSYPAEILEVGEVKEMEHDADIK